MLKIILTISGIQVLAVLLQLLKSKIVAIYLGPTGVGIVTTIDQFVQLTAFVVTFNISESSVKFLSRAYSDEKKSFGAYYTYFFKLLLVTSVTGMLLAIVLILLDKNFFGEELGKYQSFLILGLLTLPGYILGLFFVKVFAAAQNYNASSVTNFIVTAGTAFGVTVGVVSFGILGFYLGSIVGGIVITIGTTIYLQKKHKLNIWGNGLRLRSDLKQNPETLSVTIVFYFTAVASLLSYLAARYSVLVNFGEEETGFLHAALALSLVIGLILNPVVKLYFAPIINQYIDNVIKIQQAVKFQKQMIMFLGIASVLIVLFPTIILTILFSAEFVVVSQFIYLFVISQFIFLTAYINLTLLIGVDDTKGYTITYLSALIIFTLLSIALVPYYKISGVAYGHIISSTILLFSTLIWLKLKYKYVISRNLWLTGYIVAILLFAGHLGKDETSVWQVKEILLRIALFFLFTASLFLFLKDEERESILNFKSGFIK